MRQPRPIRFFGLCAAEASLLHQGASDGWLPNLQRLLDQGLWGRTHSLPGLFEGTTWPSFSTGVGPGCHGVHSGEQLRPGSYDFFHCRATDELQVPPFWKSLSDAGRRVCVLDVPHAPRSKDLNGVQLAEWGGHDVEAGFSSWPPSLAAEVAAKYGAHPWRGSCDAVREGIEFRHFANSLVAAIETKERLTKDFMARERWDFFGQVFTEAHCIGHQAWHLFDLTHPRHEPQQALQAEDPVGDVYRALDRSLGCLLEAIEKEATVVILASHGMTSSYGAQFLLDQVLLRLGVAVPPREAAEGRSIKSLARQGATSAWRLLPQNLRRRLDRQRRRARRAFEDQRPVHHRSIDPSRSQCFLVENTPAHGAIRVNVIGREPTGLIAPGKSFEDFCAALTENLMALVNLENGHRLVKRVYRRDSLYPGPASDCLPDLFIEWHNETGVTAIGSDKVGRIEGRNFHCRSGDHTPQGLFIALGEGLKPGDIGREVSILDFAPTFAQLLDVPFPHGQGAPIREITEALAPTASLD